MTEDAPATDSRVASFVRALDLLLGRPLALAESFAVAVSGGPDSLALLALAHAALGDRVHAVTVDHQLRPTSGDDVLHAAAAAAALGVPHVTLVWTGAKSLANLQATARAARYALMRDWCATNAIAWLATAHHADDAAETLLLRLARGSGAAGLGGIRPRRDLGSGVTVLRPLLGFRKDQLASVVTEYGWTAADDAANRSAAFDRTRARALLAEIPWLEPGRLAASAAYLADAEAALAWTADLAWISRCDADSDLVSVDAAGLPHDIARRLVVRAVAALASDTTPRGDGVERLLAALAAGGVATLAGVVARSDAGDRQRWHFSRAAPRRNHDACGTPPLRCDRSVQQ